MAPTVNRLGACSWGSQEHTGEQLYRIKAGWRKLSAGNEWSVMESDRRDVVHFAQGGFSEEVAMTL